MEDHEIQTKFNFIIEELRDAQEDVSHNITDLLNQVLALEKQFDSQYNLSFILTSIREKLEAIDVDNMFEFIDDLESEINSLSYNYRKAEKANRTSVYKVTNKQIPTHFNRSLL